MKRIKILYAGALVALSFSSVGCNDSESDLLEPKLYFESNVIRVEVEADTYECELVSRLSTMVKSNVTNGKPYTWRHVSTVWGRVLGNRPPQGGYGAGCLAHTTRNRT